MKRSAFTLLEVLLVAGLLAALVGAVFESVRAERRAVKRIRARLDMAAHARAAYEALARDIEGALPGQPGGFTALAPEGHAPFPGVLALVTTHRPDPLEREPGSDAWLVEYRLEPATGDDAPFALVRRATSLSITDPLPVPALALASGDARPRAVVAARLQSLHLAFSDDHVTRDTWPPRPGAADLPASVRIALSVRGEPGTSPARLECSVTLPAVTR